MSPTASSGDRLSRRELIRSGACTALALTAGLPRWAAAASTTDKVVDTQPWGRLVELADGVWAVESTPIESGDWTTGCNGGLLAGTERVVAVESFVRPAGARWLAEQARRLTGRWPTDVVITHFHGDHANGLEGYDADPRPTVWTTRTTLDLIRDADSRRETPPSGLRAEMLAGASPIAPQATTTLDLGGRSLSIQPRRGHTPSDVTLELAEPSIVFCGDLVWNGVFPNYRDTLPGAFAASIRAVRRAEKTVYVSGHGALASPADVDKLLILADSVEEAARRAHEQGVPYVDAAADYQLPTAVADWTLFNPRYFEVAFKAWHAQLSGS